MQFLMTPGECIALRQMTDHIIMAAPAKWLSQTCKCSLCTENYYQGLLRQSTVLHVNSCDVVNWQLPIAGINLCYWEIFPKHLQQILNNLEAVVYSCRYLEQMNTKSSEYISTSSPTYMNRVIVACGDAPRCCLTIFTDILQAIEQWFMGR